MKRVLLLLVAGFALSGCGQKSTPVPADAAPPPVAADAPPPADPSTANPTDEEVARAATANQESADTEAPPPATNTPLERMVAMPERAQLPDGRWKAGTHYRPVVPSQPTSVGAGEVEIIEFMWFACGHCYQIQERIGAWKTRLPAWVKFRQEHVMWGSAHRSLGRLLYTLEALGRNDLVVAVFEEIHRKNNMLVANDDARTQSLQLAFARANGISESDFRAAYNGFAVNTRLQRAEELTRRYRVDTTPLFVVNGKYITDIGMAGGGEQLTQLLNDLAAAEKR